MRKLFFLLFSFLVLYADDPPLSPHLKGKSQSVTPPWMTGPLLSPPGLIVPAGHFDSQTFVFSIANTGVYGDSWEKKDTPTLWNNLFQTLFQVGLTSWMDFQVIPGAYYNYTKGRGKWAAADIPFFLDFQLFTIGDDITQWLTGLKFSLSEIFPCGKYHNLDPDLFSADVGGRGAWQTGAGLVWNNLIYLGGKHFFMGRLSVQYYYPTSVTVKNLNVYGGGKGTSGRVRPGQTFQFDVGLELSLTQNWVIATDILGTFIGKSRFFGKTEVPSDKPTSVQFSVAPAIEYNWSTQIGMILGTWFTFAGRNSSNFTGGVISFNYYH